MEKLSSLLKDFYTVTGIRITVFDADFHEIISYPERRAAFCELLRTDDNALAMCTRCDENACRIAAVRKTTYLYECHAGLKEAIMPIQIGHLTVGYLFFGHVFSYANHETGWRALEQKCRSYHADPAALKRACLKAPVIPEACLISASHLLSAVAGYLCMEHMASLREEDLPVRIDSYIREHLTEDLDAMTICRHFNIGKTYLYKLSRENYGMGIARMIRTERLKKATEMLADVPDLPLNEIAERCGFKDYNYFITVFRKSIGTPPGKYAQNCQERPDTL
jgi:AraC-like DNA-binding protein